MTPKHNIHLHTCTEGYYGAGWVATLRILADVVEALEHPAHGAVAPAHQDLVLVDLAEDVEARQGAAVRQVKHLIWVQQLPET